MNRASLNSKTATLRWFSKINKSSGGSRIYIVALYFNAWAILQSTLHWLTPLVHTDAPAAEEEAIKATACSLGDENIQTCARTHRGDLNHRIFSRFHIKMAAINVAIIA